jgi:outer membrane protein OmpA-like peptidoglycan-associated protein
MMQLGYNDVKYQPAGNVTSFSKVSDQNLQVFVDIMVHLRPREAKIRPFLFIGPGWAHYNTPNFSKLTPGPGTPGPIVDLLPAGTGPQPSNSGFAFNYGVGVKYNATPKWGLRFDVTAMRSVIPHFNLPGYAATPGDLTVTEMGANNSITLSVGLILNMKYHYPYVAPAAAAAPPPPPAPRADLQVGAISGAHDVCPGETVQLSVTASGFAGQTPSYQWMVNGAPATGATAATFSVPTLIGGNKTVTVQVSAGDSSRTSAPISFLVRPTPPPTIQFGVSPSTVTYGARINLAATATGSVCTNPVTVRYSGEGVSGSTFDSTTLNFDQSNRLRQQSRTVHITATATDSKNQTANAGADVTVTLTAQAHRLDDIVFPQNSSRVNNCAKRLLLEELTPMLRSDPNAKVILIGHRDTTERARMNPPLDEARVINAAAVLSAGKGICPSLDLSRLSVNWVGTEQSSETRPALCGTSTNVKELGGQAIRQSDTHAQYRRVEIWIVPGGADMPAGMSGLKAAPATQIQAKGCPK